MTDRKGKAGQDNCDKPDKLYGWEGVWTEWAFI